MELEGRRKLKIQFLGYQKLIHEYSYRSDRHLDLFDARHALLFGLIPLSLPKDHLIGLRNNQG